MHKKDFTVCEEVNIFYLLLSPNTQNVQFDGLCEIPAAIDAQSQLGLLNALSSLCGDILSCSRDYDISLNLCLPSSFLLLSSIDYRLETPNPFFHSDGIFTFPFIPLCGQHFSRM